ncbi:UNVERIFIED_CONTAM: putative 6-phosphogluconolactonase 4, chloroplastic [Sesamum radiatum]|uniref:Probable 6-phosphogluconolactonase n=1 Tax=Sesamum radiatum TaxID=300843 RepID=A0AAW2KF05_SESRA
MVFFPRKMTEAPMKETIDWSKWWIVWGDERVVPLDDPQSNYYLALNGFLSKVAIPKNQIFPIHYSPSSEAVAKDYEAQLKKLVEQKVLPLSATGFPKFDLMLLGIGPDGHVASLFPNLPQRYDKTNWVTYLNDSPKPPPKRITFTFPVINSADHIAMVVTGKELAEAVDITLEQKPIIPPLPCSEVKAQGREPRKLSRKGGARTENPTRFISLPHDLSSSGVNATPLGIRRNFVLMAHFEGNRMTIP